MGKKRTRGSYTSKGERRSVAKSTCKLVAKDVNVLQKEEFKRDAWRKGKNPWVVVPGFTPKESLRRVRANEAWGSPKQSSSNSNKEKESEWA